MCLRYAARLRGFEPRSKIEPGLALNQARSSTRGWLLAKAPIFSTNDGSPIPHSPHSAMPYGLRGYAW